MAAQIRRVINTAPVISFLRLEDYSQGGGLPDGDYLWSDLQFVMFQPQRRDGTVVGPARLSVQITMEPPAGATTEEEKRVQNYSMGTNAHLTYQPDPATRGKSLALVPDGPASPLYENTNWHYLLKSIHDTTTLPEDLNGNDLSVFEGMVAHMVSIPEPEERKSFRSSIAEVDPQASRRANKIAVVAEVKVAPWLEGASASPVPKTTLAQRVAATAPKRTTTAKLPLPGVGLLQTHTTSSTSLPPAESNGVDIPSKIAAILEANMNGLAKTSLRMSIFKDVRGLPNGQALMDQYFSNDAVLDSLLGQWGYKLEGTAPHQNIVVA